MKEENKIFHAGPATDGFGGIFFSLYKDNMYQFCDGDFMDWGCYTGKYALSGDTIILYELKKHKGIPTNKFIIRRYHDMDSSYWQWKYSKYHVQWEDLRHSDSTMGSGGDVFPLDQKNEIVFDKYYYFLIRSDKLKEYYLPNK